MPNATLPAPVERPRDADPLAHRGPILVASDGTTACDAALVCADLLAGSKRLPVILLSVVEPVAVVPMDFGIALPFADIEQAQREARFAKLTEQLDRLGLGLEGWAMQIEYGDPATCIAGAARKEAAAVVICGLGHHDLSDRIFGSETAIRALRASSLPVLAIPGNIDRLPRRVVIATDFSVASLEAARAALDLFPDIDEIHLVHAMSRLEVPPDVMVTWDGLYSEPIAETFQRLIALLDLPESIRIKKVTREGKAAREVVRYAQSIDADLIVTGSRGAGFMSRLLVGSTATGIIRGADTAVLAVPSSRGSDRMIGVEKIKEATDDEQKWSELLATFTRRNIGRRATLEVDDPDYGLLMQEHGYPLRGVAYDRHDQKLFIMLGDLEGTNRHLTRGILNPRSIEVLRTASGKDHALRVSHGRGQTFLTFEH